jgi:hypothetical protein
MKKTMVAVIIAATITVILLVGCGSKADSLGKGTSGEVSDNNALQIDAPRQDQTFEERQIISVSGTIHKNVNNVVNVQLFQIPSKAAPSRRNFVAKSQFPIGADGSFKGDFQVPKPPFQGSNGGQFVMVFVAPGKANASFSASQVVYLSIPAVKK